jgi:uncharacterized membrane protein YccF (DUF307 family)
VVRTLGNILWFVLAGWWLALLYTIAGVIACILIITIPFGIASFRIAGYALWPFGRTIVVAPGAGLPSIIGNVIWIVLFGWGLFVAHLVAGLLLLITIIGIPFGIASIKMSVVALIPLGTRIVDVQDAVVPSYSREPAAVR